MSLAHSTGRDSLARPRVFVVDDEAIMLLTLGAILRAAGYAVETFDHPTALLARLSAKDEGCVVLDLQMPGMNGLELQRVLGHRGIALPLLFVSGSRDSAAAVTAMEQGALAFLSKPVNPKALLAGVARALGLK